MTIELQKLSNVEMEVEPKSATWAAMAGSSLQESSWPWIRFCISRAALRVKVSVRISSAFAFPSSTRRRKR